MKPISEYLSPLINQIKQGQIKTNICLFLEKIYIQHESRIYTLSKDKSEYVKQCRMFNGDLKTIVDVNKLNSSLLTNSIPYFKKKDIVFIVHDCSPIRKPESQKLASLGKVMSLNHTVVSGFDTFCSILIDVNHARISLLGCTPFSNGDVHFVSKSERKLHETGQLKDTERGKQIDEFDKNGLSIDQSVIISNQINKIDVFLKSEDPELCIVDIIDRGFDDQKFFKELKTLQHEFICRAKGNRKSNEIIFDEDGKEKSIKLIKEQFIKGDEINYSSIKFKQKTYQNCKGVFEWNNLVLDKNVYSALRVSLYQRNGSRIFKEDMLIITSFEIEDIKMAQLIWELYMKRSKIESVFKFCKEELKWEAPRGNDWTTMQNLLSAVYFIAGYFYEIKDELVKNEEIQWLATLGNGKGKISVHFLLKGLAKLVNYHEIKNAIETNIISEKQIQDALKLYSLSNL